MKQNILIFLITIFYLSGCDNASETPETTPETPLELHGESKIWQKVPTNWDYEPNDEVLIARLATSNQAIPKPKMDNYSITEWDEKVKSECKNWTELVDEDDEGTNKWVCEDEHGSGEYQKTLIEQVSTIDDSKTIEPLIDSLATVSGTIIADSLAKFGDKAIKALIKKYGETENPDLQSALLFTIDRILQKNASLLSNNNEELKALLLKGLKSPDEFVRESAIGALKSLGDSSVIPALEEIANNDNFAIHGSGSGRLDTLAEGEVVYWLRDFAKEAIQELKRNGKP